MSNFNSQEHWTIWFCLVGVLVMLGIFCTHASSDEPLTNKQEFYLSIDEQLQDYTLLLEDLILLDEIGDLDAIDAKRAQIYMLMQNILERKRALFQAEVDRCEVRYIAMKKGDQTVVDVKKLQWCHLNIRQYEDSIDRISKYVKFFNKRVKYIEDQKEQRNVIVISKEELAEKKDTIVAKLRPLVSRINNLEFAGASPNEINQVKREIRNLELSLIDLCVRAQQDEDLFMEEIRQIKAEVSDDLDIDSQRRKNLTDKYKYRFDQRETRSAIKYNRVNEKGMTVKRAAKQEDKKIDHRLNAPRSDHDKPSKTIER